MGTVLSRGRHELGSKERSSYDHRHSLGGCQVLGCCVLGCMCMYVYVCTYVCTRMYMYVWLGVPFGTEPSWSPVGVQLEPSLVLRAQWARILVCR